MFMAVYWSWRRSQNASKINKPAPAQAQTITLLPRTFGRGIDFKCFDKELDDRGVAHVIQAFFSRDKSENIQIYGRTGRHCKNGSYETILNADELAIPKEAWKGLEMKKDASKITSLLDNLRLRKVTSKVDGMKAHHTKCLTLLFFSLFFSYFFIVKSC